jgi:hypothetical protein
LGIEGTQAPLNVRTVSGDRRLESMMVSFDLQSVCTGETITVHRAWTVNALQHLPCISVPHIRYEAWNHLKDIHLPITKSSNISILIGCDVPKAHWVLDQKTGEPDDPYAVKSPLGWILLGPVCSNQSPSPKKARIHYLCKNERLDMCLERMFNYEFNEAACSARALSKDDQLVLKYLKKSIKVVNGHYQVPLP